jgi:ankyrin repeat protein
VQQLQTSELPETMPSKKDMLKRFNELSSDGHSKLMIVDKNGNTDNYHLMLKRAQNINKSQNLYQAKVSETVGEAIGRNNKEKYYYISLTPREDISLLDKMQNISNEEILKRIKICEG